MDVDINGAARGPLAGIRVLDLDRGIRPVVHADPR